MTSPLHKTLLMVLAFAGLNYSSTYAQGNQCPGCNIDPLCTSTTNFPVLCPATLPNGTQMQPYDENVTFFMPDKVDASGFNNLDLTNVTVVGLSGMPLGLYWTTNTYPTNSYAPTSNVATQRGCVKICGTPLVPGNYNVVVNVTVTVCDIPIVGCSTLAQSFTLPITITAAAGGNSYFSFNPGSGCDSINVNFKPNFTPNNPVQMVAYSWDFGNGQNLLTADTATQTQSYPNVGQFYPSLATKLYNFRLKSLSATVTGGWWCGDIEELNCGNGNPDVYFITTGGLSHTTSSVSNTMTPSWTNINQLLTGNGVTFQFMEEDNISQNDNGGATFINIPGPGTYTGSTTAISSGGGGVNFSFVIDTALIQTFHATDTIDVLPLPSAPALTATPGFTACGNQNIVLHAPGGYNYTWFINDTTIIPNETDSFLVIGIPTTFPHTANYRVVIADTITGCAASSISYPVTYKEPIPAQFANLGAVYTFSGTLTTYYNNMASYQWLYNGTPIVPAGQTQTYTPTANGQYSVIITNPEGCSDTSNIVLVMNVGIEEVLNENMFSLFPNPNNGTFTIQAENHVQKVSEFSVINVLGQKLYTTEVHATDHTWTHTLSLENLTPGIYSAVVSYPTGKITKKFIVK